MVLIRNVCGNLFRLGFEAITPKPLEMLYHRGMWRVGADRPFHHRQGFKIAAPDFSDSARVFKISFVEVFDVCSVKPSQMGTLLHTLHKAVSHGFASLAVPSRVFPLRIV